MKKNHLAAYQRPQVTIYRIGLSLPLAGSLVHPGGDISPFEWEEEENTNLDTPGGDIAPFEWE